MRLIHNPVRTILCLLIFAYLGHSQNRDYAELWLKGTDQEKKIFISGLMSGMSAFKYFTEESAKEHLKNTPDSSWNNWSKLMDTVYTELDFSKKGFSEINVVRTIDLLYKKEKNKFLTYQEIYLAALNELVKISSKRKLKDAAKK